MKIVAIIQARMTSTRLPGKVLKKVLDKPLLEYQIERIQRSKHLHEIVIATTTNETDNPIVELANKLGINVYRGSEEDVLSRYHEAAIQYGADIIVRLTSDCPVIDPKVVDNVIQYYLENQSRYDYVSNTLTRSYPRGMDTEVFTFQALKESYNEAEEKHEREHVTPFIYLRPNRYSLGSVQYITDKSTYRWTVDTPEDFELIRRIIENLYPSNPHFTLEDTITLLETNPDWLEINRMIEQKELGE
ncbi:cytidylyltransferase domain-containing protein [Tepidibacillus fermentans]|uniref:Spore coat polysaccharide biosynthesis protein SpsF n=1 Tax=Tepidibacillus fermentans TaxID=1281767 RepID=A0A4R3KID4_9BACI|nr:glycosyltransferase family protein [Tepidibacillus fermentans]TCS83310.1 spore coat polysaccharide biosynthesis protein SpsF [Tepidibacillus fermentans]